MSRSVYIRANVPPGNSNGPGHPYGFPLRAIPGFIFAVLISGFYALPNTPYSEFIISAGGHDALTRAVQSSWCPFLAAAVVIFLYSPSLNGHAERISLLEIVVTAYLILCLVSSFSSDQALNASCRIIVMSLCAGLLSAKLCRTHFLRFLVITSIASAQAVYALIGFNEHMLVLYSGNVGRASGTFDQPNDLYTLLLLSLFPSLYLLVACRGKVFPLLLSASMTALIACLLVLTWERAAFLAAGVGLVLFLATFLKHRRVALVLNGVLISFLVLFGWAHRSSGYQDSQLAQRSVWSRAEFFKDNIQRIKEHVLTGTGINRDPNNSYFGMQAPGAFFSKNLLLSLMVEFGIFGFALFLFACIGIYGAVNSVNKPLLRVTLSVSWIALFIACIFDDPVLTWSRPDGNMLLGFLFGATLLSARGQIKPRQKLSLPETAPSITAPL